jgi:hypothetical protein
VSQTSQAHVVDASSGALPAADRAVVAERCLRCAATMEWRHGTWQCPACRFKIGCCEGPTAECFPDR